jgi:hypothetical protein
MTLALREEQSLLLYISLDVLLCLLIFLAPSVSVLVPKACIIPVWLHLSGITIQLFSIPRHCWRLQHVIISALTWIRTPHDIMMDINIPV